MKKVLALVLVLAMIFSFAACGSKNQEAETTTAAETLNDEDIAATVNGSADESQNAADVSENSSEAAVTGEAVSDEASTAEESTAAAKMPESKAEILAAYTEVMNYVKTAHPGFTKIEYQNLPESKRHFSNATVLKIAANFMTSKEKATKNPEVREKGYDGYWFPVYKSTKGCLLTDTNALKSAKCEKLSNGNYKITLVLNPEMNPEPTPEGSLKSPSNIGAVFGPVSKKEIDDTLNNNKLVNVFLKSATYSLKYYDCTSIVIYNPVNNHIQKLEQYNHVLITADAKTIVGGLSGDAVLDNTMQCTAFKY